MKKSDPNSIIDLNKIKMHTSKEILVKEKKLKK